ncbi:MAG: hypothetical protein LBR37_04595 [Erysipelotrichaceae bacterium]|jgi:phosphoglucosamine mutase|nr:hypothetical protein [Erysipelotrichaceae bacterium]
MSKNYFGTDGIRGLVATFLTPEFAVKIGQAYGRFLQEKTIKAIVIGHDTRVSGPTLIKAFLSGIKTFNIKISYLGIVPTPCISYLCKHHGFQNGVMVTASHNPYQYNGFKFFSSIGTKLDKEDELRISRYIDETPTLKYEMTPLPSVDKKLRAFYYQNFLTLIRPQTTPRILIDCGFGAATKIMRWLKQTIGQYFKAFDLMHTTYDGININHNAGATALDRLVARIKRTKQYDFGVAFDGDADRMLLVDQDGNIIKGESILAFFAENLHLKAIVTTIMTNKGIVNYLENAGTQVILTDVGDSNVTAAMIKNNVKFGGENSGHFIFLDYLNSGDAVYAFFAFLNLYEATKKLHYDASFYPATLINFRLTIPGSYQNSHELHCFFEDLSREIGTKGYLNIRLSGTEPLLRVLIERESDELLEATKKRVLEALNNAHL